MANLTVTAETAGGAVADANLLRTVQSGSSVKTTFTQIKTWIQSWIEVYLYGAKQFISTVSPTLSVDLANKKYIIFNPASATIVTTWTNVVVGKLYFFKADSGNTNVSISQDNAYLIAPIGGKITLAGDAGVVFIGESATLLRQVTVPVVTA